MIALSFGWWCVLGVVGYVLFLAAFLFCWARLKRGGGDDDDN